MLLKGVGRLLDGCGLVAAMLFAVHVPLQARVRILTFHYNMPEFIELQQKTLNKFLKNKYELIVFNDAKAPENELAIKKTCRRLGIRCVRYEQARHRAEPLNEQIFVHLNAPGVLNTIGVPDNSLEGMSNHPSLRHCHVIQYALDHFGYAHNDIVVIMDSDFFPVRPINLRALLRKNQIIGSQSRKGEADYLWVPFIAMKMASLPNKKELRFHVDRIGDCVYDSGAHSYHYLKNNPHVRVKKYPVHESITFKDASHSDLRLAGFKKEQIALTRALPKPLSVEFHIGHRFIHFRGVSFAHIGNEARRNC